VGSIPFYFIKLFHGVKYRLYHQDICETGWEGSSDPFSKTGELVQWQNFHGYHSQKSKFPLWSQISIPYIKITTQEKSKLLQKHPNNCFSFLTLGNYVIPPLKICFFN
jgi:hypothetical protein